LDDNDKTSAIYRRRKWLVGSSVIGVTAALLIVYLATTNFGSSPASVSIPYLSKTAKLIPGVAPGAAGQQSNNSQPIKHIVPLDPHLPHITAELSIYDILQLQLEQVTSDSPPTVTA
jgi:hypothetical protein